MNIVEALSLQLKLPENAARGLAGQLLGLIEDTVREKVSFGVASKIRDAVPEMIDWQTSAPTLAPGSLHINELPLPTPLGDEATGASSRITKSDSALVASLALQFLSSRLDPFDGGGDRPRDAVVDAQALRVSFEKTGRLRSEAVWRNAGPARTDLGQAKRPRKKEP